MTSQAPQWDLFELCASCELGIWSEEDWFWRIGVRSSRRAGISGAVSLRKAWRAVGEWLRKGWSTGGNSFPRAGEEPYLGGGLLNLLARLKFWAPAGRAISLSGAMSALGEYQTQSEAVTVPI